jgi:hypothetical protein
MELVDASASGNGSDPGGIIIFSEAPCKELMRRLEKGRRQVGKL